MTHQTTETKLKYIGFYDFRTFLKESIICIWSHPLAGSFCVFLIPFSADQECALLTKQPWNLPILSAPGFNVGNFLLFSFVHLVRNLVKSVFPKAAHMAFYNLKICLFKHEIFDFNFSLTLQLGSYNVMNWVKLRFKLINQVRDAAGPNKHRQSQLVFVQS